MEEWNIGMMGKKIECLNPLFQYSSIPMFQLFLDSSIPICGLCVLCFLFVHPLVSIPGGSKGKEQSISIK
jgi:hypothetical protein